MPPVAIVCFALDGTLDMGRANLHFPVPYCIFYRNVEGCGHTKVGQRTKQPLTGVDQVALSPGNADPNDFMPSSESNWNCTVDTGITIRGSCMGGDWDVTSLLYIILASVIINLFFLIS